MVRSLNTIYLFPKIKLLLIFYIADQDKEEIQEIPLPNIKSHILVKIIAYFEHYQIDPMKVIEKVFLILDF